MTTASAAYIARQRQLCSVEFAPLVLLQRFLLLDGASRGAVVVEQVVHARAEGLIGERRHVGDECAEELLAVLLPPDAD